MEVGEELIDRQGKEHQDVEEKPRPLSLHNMMGIISRRTMKLWGHLNDRKVMILINWVYPTILLYKG